MQEVQYYIEASSLFEENWTGIPVVAANLSRELLRIHPNNTGFFFEHRLLTQEYVEDALKRNSGKFLEHFFFSGPANAGAVDVANNKKIKVGLFPSIKRVRGVFDVECSIIHDLSTLIVPQFHTAENIDYHMNAFYDDVQSNALTGCVSQATLEDVKQYFGIPESKLAVFLNGFQWDQNDIIAAKNSIDPGRIEPYFIILGTREPRKNIMRIIEMLELFPEFMETHKFVFAGKMGWLMDHEELAPSIRFAKDNGRIIFPGFVTERQKCALLMGAEASIYPSYFEGFGLPIVESLALGTPCIASWTSSIPEVGGDTCYYFDPYSVSDLSRAVAEVVQRRPKKNLEIQSECRKQASLFSWKVTVNRIMAALEPHIEAATTK